MDTTRFIKELKTYKSKLEGVLSRFQKTQDSIDIKEEDDPIYRQMVQEIMDLLDDTIGKNSYSGRIAELYNEGLANFEQSPSYKSVENIIGTIGAILTRASRNENLMALQQDVGARKELPSRGELVEFEKVTLAWLSNNVPMRIWWILFSALILSFGAGVVAGQTSFVQELMGNHIPEKNSITSELNETRPMSAEAERFLRLIDKYQRDLNETKLIVLRNGAIVFDDPEKAKQYSINLIGELFSVKDNFKEYSTRFENIVLSIPDRYLRSIPETRLDSPFVLQITHDGMKHINQRSR